MNKKVVAQQVASICAIIASGLIFSQSFGNKFNPSQTQQGERRARTALNQSQPQANRIRGFGAMLNQPSSAHRRKLGRQGNSVMQHSLDKNRGSGAMQRANGPSRSNHTLSAQRRPSRKKRNTIDQHSSRPFNLAQTLLSRPMDKKGVYLSKFSEGDFDFKDEHPKPSTK